MLGEPDDTLFFPKDTGLSLLLPPAMTSFALFLIYAGLNGTEVKICNYFITPALFGLMLCEPTVFVGATLVLPCVGSESGPAAGIP